MKIALISDVHLEFGDCFFENTETADVLILGGDIMIAQELHDFKDPVNDLHLKMVGHRAESVIRYRNFLRRCSDMFKHVIYIAGNHEFYHGKWPIGIDYLREEVSNYPNITFLENETKDINKVSFVGCTLWTDMNKNDPNTLFAIRRAMNDYNTIRNSEDGYRKFSPEDTVKLHKQSLKYIESVVTKDPTKTYVVVGHHAPSKQSHKPRYEKDHLLNGAYSSDLSEFMLDHPQIKLWTHGHTHDKFDYVIGETRIVCNPRGYVGYEVDTEHAELTFLDI